MLPGSVSSRFAIALHETQRLNSMVQQFGKTHKLPEKTVFMIGLSLDELVTNIVVHSGSRDPRAQEIVLRLSSHNHQVKAEIEDDGIEFNPLDMPSPDLNAPLQDRDIGGMGIHLARSFMDDICYSRVGCRNVVTLTKRVD